MKSGEQDLGVKEDHGPRFNFQPPWRGGKWRPSLGGGEKIQVKKSPPPALWEANSDLEKLGPPFPVAPEAYLSLVFFCNSMNFFADANIPNNKRNNGSEKFPALWSHHHNLGFPSDSSPQENLIRFFPLFFPLLLSFFAV